MVLEQVCVADVGCEHVGAAVSADLLQLKHAGPGPGSCRDEARSQRVPGEARRFVGGRGGAGLDHAGDGTVAHGIGGGEAALQLAEHGAPGDGALRQPGVE